MYAPTSPCRDLDTNFTQTYYELGGKPRTTFPLAFDSCFLPSQGKLQRDTQKVNISMLQKSRLIIFVKKISKKNLPKIHEK